MFKRRGAHLSLRRPTEEPFMKRYFRMVHFVPDPISGARFPMGALVHDGRARRTVLANRLPGPESLGGMKTARLLNLLLDDLEKLRTEEEIYQRLGPQVLVEERSLIPDGVKDPLASLRLFRVFRRLFLLELLSKGGPEVDQR